MRRSGPGRAEGSFGSAVWGAAALLGLAGLAGAAHSWFVPVYLTRAPRAVAAAPAPADPARPSDAAAGSAAPDAGAAPDAAPEAPAATPLPEGRITLAEAVELWDQGVFFFDARDEPAYTRGHVNGAFHLNTEKLRRSGEGLELVQSLPKDATYVVYCTGGDCHDAENVATELERIHGFTSVFVMQAGFSEWAAAGYPVEEGAP